LLAVQGITLPRVSFFGWVFPLFVIRRVLCCARLQERIRYAIELAVVLPAVLHET